MQRPALKPLAIPALILSICSLLGSGCMSDQLLKNTTATRAKSANAVMHLPPVVGPPPTLAVTGFKNQAGYRSQYDLGNNLESMLESAMVDTRSFRMVDRTALGSVLAEQQLKKSGQAVGPGAAEPGRIASARYIVEGAITEASEGVQGTGGNIGLPIGRTRIGVGGEYTRAQLTAIIKVIDTTTSEIVAKETVRGTSGNVAVNLGVGNRRGVSGNFGSFAKTPMAEAAQDVINQAAAFVTTAVYHHRATAAPVARAYAGPPPPATAAPAPTAAHAVGFGPGKVAIIDGPDIVVNRGAEHGVVVGQTFQILEGGNAITDPDTGAVIGQTRGRRVAVVEVTSVEGKLSRTRLKEGVLPVVGQTAL